jgi:tRNA threonylcarbamoyladenosine biosynthesis protein TsaE
MNSVLEITIHSQNELHGLAQPILDLYGNPKTILFDAPMGAGKTTFIKELCVALGSTDNFSSPTYSIVNEYLYPGGKIYHFDLYRLNSLNELFDIGIEEYLDSGHYCIFEWPKLIEGMINVNYKLIQIEVNENIRYIRVIKK